MRREMIGGAARGLPVGVAHALAGSEHLLDVGAPPAAAAKVPVLRRASKSALRAPPPRGHGPRLHRGRAAAPAPRTGSWSRSSTPAVGRWLRRGRSGLINKRQFVAEGFEALPPADRLLVAQRVQIAGL